MTTRARTVLELTVCLVAGLAVASAGGAVVGDNLGFFGEQNGPYFGLGVLLALVGLAAIAIGAIGLLVVGFRALKRGER